MLVVGIELGLAHFLQTELFPDQVQAGCRGIIPHLPCVQVVNPLLQRAFGHLVEFIHFQYVIFWKQLADAIHLEPLLLERRQIEDVSQMLPFELGLPVVEVVLAHAEGKIDDVHAVDLADFLVIVAPIDVLA